jgi:hypothetical protein
MNTVFAETLAGSTNNQRAEENRTMSDLNTVCLNPEERTRCEVWTRVMGYHRPVSAFNLGKRAEHADRCYFTESPQGRVLRAVHRAAA